MKKVLSAAVAAVFACSAASVAMAGEMVIPGSTTVQKRILEPAKDAIEAATGISVKVEGVGSGGGFKKLIAGETVVSIASSPLTSLLSKNKLADDGTYQEHVIIEDSIVPIVNAKNSVTALNWEQLAGLNTGKFKNWSEVGGGDCKVTVITSHPGSATRKVFQKQVMKKAAYVAGAKEVKSTRQEVGKVAKSKCAIGAVSKAFVELDKKNQQKIRIVQTKAITRPLSFITKGNPTAEVLKLITFLKTAEAAKHFR